MSGAEAESGIERRRYPRYEIKAEVILFGTQSSFKTETKNISLNGALIAEPIPIEMLGEVLDLVLIFNNGIKIEKILLHAIIAGAPFRTARLFFVNTPMTQFLKLQDLLGQAIAA